MGARFFDNYEERLLQWIDSGGQNQTRPILTRALSVAHVGLWGIPKKFLVGLENSKELVDLAQELGEEAEFFKTRRRLSSLSITAEDGLPLRKD